MVYGDELAQDTTTFRSCGARIEYREPLPVLPGLDDTNPLP